MAEVDLVKVELEWYKQILEHINKVLSNPEMTDNEKVSSATWLVKQLKKSDRDD